MNNTTSTIYNLLCKGSLFEAVQNTLLLYEDCKTFVDSTPKISPDIIKEKYRRASEEPDFNLYDFIQEYFIIDSGSQDNEQVEQKLSMKEHIQSLWPSLVRGPDSDNRKDTYIPLPYEYVVPGGRFKEIYYWDTYFTAEGLLHSKQSGLIKCMVKNLEFLINTFGHIPNGNRIYYLTRSQPPFFACLLTLLEKTWGIKEASAFTQALEKEYHFWMKGSECLDGKTAARQHVVMTESGALLNRYWDDANIPRPESYREDLEIFKKRGEKNPDLYRDIRAACESGWDFSSRWLSDPCDLASIETTRIAPIDLNCLLYNMEHVLSRYFRHLGNEEKAETYKTLAEKRVETINTIFFNKNTGFYHDIYWENQAHTNRTSLAALYPLFFGICDEKQALAVAENIEKEFLESGGLLTTKVKSGQQWDSPNGWAPLHWIAVRGLRKYGFYELADDIKDRWLQTNERCFKATGKMMERYNVLSPDDLTFGGEYPAQDGFGWTNAIALAFLQE